MKNKGHWNMAQKPENKKASYLWKLRRKTWKQESLISLKIEAQAQRHTLTKSYGDRAEDSSTPESLMSLKIEAQPPRTLRSLRVDS